MLADTEAGLPLVFVERVDGHVEPGSMDILGTVDYGPPMRYSMTPASHAVVSSFPKIVEKIAAAPFDGMGSFWPSKDGPVLGGHYAKDGRQFKTFADYLGPCIRDTLKRIDHGAVQIREHVPQLFYLSLLELLDLVSNDPDMSRPEPMFLDHGDQWQFMFDTARTRIVGIIDWER
jgi:hypothetical protein